MQYRATMRMNSNGLLGENRLYHKSHLCTNRPECCENSKRFKIINASKIGKRIEKGLPVRFDNCIIRGNLDLQSLSLPKKNRHTIIASRISITNCRIEETLNLNNIIFKNNPVNFDGSRFSSEALFSESIFCQGGYFTDTQFEDKSRFREAKFCSTVCFTGAKFNKYADFDSAIFCNENNAEAIFDGSNFLDYANFNKTKFYSNVRFNWAIFNDYANFNDSTFNKFARFDNVVFKYCQFERSNFGRNSMLSMNGTNYEKLFIEWNALYKPKYILNFKRFGFLDIGNGDNILFYNNLVYNQLIKNFNDLARFEDADSCNYYYRNRRRKDLNSIYKVLDIFFMLAYGYSVMPLRPLAWSLFFLLLFSLIYTFIGKDIGFINAIPMTDGFNLSLNLLLSGTKLIADPKLPSTGLLYWIFNLEKILGSLFFGLFILSIGKKVIR